MLKRVKEFNLSHWLLNQRANYYTLMADKAVNRYKKKAGLK
jgi:hypothetical protein